jgi:glycosyltransferase involved in cell wall biosynthesis
MAISQGAVSTSVNWRERAALQPGAEVAPAVSVVIPAWNAAKYIREAATSVLAQTFRDLELIVVDDGSTDGTADVVRAEPDSRIRLITQPNAGPSAARNRGCRAARSSRYIAFLDADDTWDADKLRQQVAFLDANRNCGAVGTLVRYVSSAGRPVGYGGERVTAASRDAVARGELYPFHAMGTMVARRDVLDRVGDFDEALGRIGSEDLDFVARLAQIAPIDVLPAVLASYRVHSESAMARHRARINQGARFVRSRLRARSAGSDLTWDAFAVSERLSWRQRRQDAVERCYRNAALWFGERHMFRTACWVILALAVDPVYTVGRARRQRKSGEAFQVEGTPP